MHGQEEEEKEEDVTTSQEERTVQEALARVTPTVSIILITRRPDWARHCVRALTCQVGIDWECLMVTDENSDVAIPADSRFRRVIGRTPHIHSEAFDMAIAKAQGEYIAWQDDDDWRPPWSIAHQVEQLQRRPRRAAAAIWSDMLCYDAMNAVWRRRIGSWIYDCGTVFRRAAWECRAGDVVAEQWLDRVPRSQIIGLRDMTLYLRGMHNEHTCRQPPLDRRLTWTRLPFTMAELRACESRDRMIHLLRGAEMPEDLLDYQTWSMNAGELLL